ncbi:hypothetical protein PY257_05940 [Ramlibacter sp. H39-3-26]|uniref:hypothetical protein n=1 Tax=Curvibacter soli TaxID=3031331 RepID=UPI0023DA4BE5|nr:hypothetical protein [Ramlibacter sp. H39-3-26]MDF1484729.1 hypothetical protein [Ramlibacter sp. H39-3-26]
MLSMLQVLAPFLHTHFGGSHLHGWHIHVQRSTMDHAAKVAWSAAPQPALAHAYDAAEVDVEQGPQPVERPAHPIDQQAALWFVAIAAVSLLLLGASFALQTRSALQPVWRLPPPRWHRPNAPPPALAPPARARDARWPAVSTWRHARALSCCGLPA